MVNLALLLLVGALVAGFTSLFLLPPTYWGAVMGVASFLLAITAVVVLLFFASESDL